MGIKVKAIERNVAFEKGKQKWAYVMQADLYGQLTQSKVIEEAAVRSGLAKQVINAAWGAIGAVITAWATEGHSVAVPGLGTTPIQSEFYRRGGCQQGKQLAHQPPLHHLRA